MNPKDKVFCSGNSAYWDSYTAQEGNPHSKGTPEHKEWGKGWAAARTEELQMKDKLGLTKASNTPQGTNER